jgi:hypothetical protein
VAELLPMVAEPASDLLSGPVVCTWWRTVYLPSGWRWRTSWAGLAARFAEPGTYPIKSKLRRWSVATFREDDEGRGPNYRALKNIEAVAGIVLDLDGESRLAPTRDRVAEAFGGLLVIAHTTWSSTPELSRWRVTLPSSRLMTRDEHDRVWRAAVELVELAGMAPDYRARDASHPWAVPAQRPGYEHLVLDGAPLDVEAALARFPCSPPPEAPPVTTPMGDELARRIWRASLYLAKIPPAIANSGGHAVTYRAACRLVHDPRFALPPDVALHLMLDEYNGRCEPPWSERDLRHKIADAVTKGRAPSTWCAGSQGSEQTRERGRVDRFTVQRAKLRRRQEDPNRQPIWRVTFDLVSDDGELFSYRFTVPSDGYFSDAIRTRYRAALADVDCFELRTECDCDLTSRLAGRVYEIERSNGEVRKVQLIARGRPPC